MTIEFIGYIGTRKFSETHPAEGPIVDRAHIEAAARAHEEGGFDRALVAFHSTSPESILIAQHAASITERLGLMVAHRPGFTAPTLAARQFATLDQLSGGRAAVHIITGGDDAELRQDGSFLGKDERYARTDEYLEVMRKEWMSTEPFDHEGRFYRFERAFSAVTHAQVREIVARVRAATAKHGRQLRFSLSLRPILADTEAAAWAKANAILERAKEIAGETGFRRSKEPENAGSHRLLAAAAQGARLDKRLWTELAAFTGAKGNSTSLVGTPDQVADALLDYFDLGITTFLIRGFDVIEDTVQYGKELLPRTRELIARKRAEAGIAAQ